jgi:hypothetical protein
VQDGFLQCSLDNVVIEWGAFFSEKKSQWLPVVQQIRNGLAQPGVRFRFGPHQLISAPFVQLLHQWQAVLLVELQTLLGIQALLSRQRIVAVHHAERFQNILALLWEAGGYIHELASPVSHTVGQQDFHSVG